MIRRRAILDRLAAVGFKTGEGTIAPFGNPLPLVSGWATEPTTASLVLVVEDQTAVTEDEQWRELLFAVSGLRHELRDGGAPAIGTPVVLALLPDAGAEQRLRALIEELSREYVLFSRIELNVIVETDSEPSIDLALAPLLPRCREALSRGDTIGGEVADALAEELRAAIEEASQSLAPALHSAVRPIAASFSGRLASLITESADGSALSPTIWDTVYLQDFRSFADEQIRFGELTVAEGLNGTGKSSLVEALEILWSGSTQRKPADATTGTYDQHLYRDGDHEWLISAHERDAPADALRRVGATEQTSSSVLARNVYSQDGSPDIARDEPSMRYAELLRITGLAIPELLAECENINREAKAQLDEALSRVKLPPTKSIAVRALDNVVAELATGVGKEAPSSKRVNELQSGLAELAKEHGLVFRPFDTATPWADTVHRLGTLATTLAPELRSTDELVELASEVHEGVRASARRTDEIAMAIDVLLAALVARRQPRDRTETIRDTAGGGLRGEEGEPGLAPEVSRKWLFAGRSLRQSVEEIRQTDLESVAGVWRHELNEFLQRAEDTLEHVPFDSLERATRTQRGEALQRQSISLGPIDRDDLRAAGFEPTSVTDIPPTIEEHLRDLSGALHDYGVRLQSFAESVLASPLVALRGREEDLVGALAQFELARVLKKPVARTQDELLTRLISGPLEPLLVELIMALTRFEWYFHPPTITVRPGAVGLHGLATKSPQLDARMLLNAGERAIVTLAWFLALHLLQGKEQRRVLVLDDPFSPLDENNQAALISTLRTFARLTRPEFLMICTHDRVVADSVERDFAAIHDWPRTVARLRFARSPEATTIVDGDVVDSPMADYVREVARLGLDADHLTPARSN